MMLSILPDNFPSVLFSHLLATGIANRQVSAKSFNCEAFNYVFYVVEENL